jgi:hypothetical protein
MPTADPQPVITHVKFDVDSFNTNGFIHRRKKGRNNENLVTHGFVRGTNLKLGLVVQVKQGQQTWNGGIVSGPHLNTHQQEYWNFDVASDVDEADPGQDDTISVTVTNIAAMPPTSAPVPADPQPTVVDP